MLLVCLVSHLLGWVRGWLFGFWVVVILGFNVCGNQVLKAVWRLGSTPSTGLYNLIVTLCRCPVVTGCHNAACVPGWPLAWLGAWLVIWFLGSCYPGF